MRLFPAFLIVIFRACLWLVLGGLVVPATVRAYELEGPRWPSDQPIVMYLQLTNPKPPLLDGSVSWDAVGSSALSIWNKCLGSGVRFSVGGTLASQTRGDGKNTVFFDSSVFGYSFGDDTLAVTVWATDAAGSTFTEADVVVNSAVPFNSYRGPLQYARGCDLRRVLLHEFGHVLGLDHVAQNVAAVMTPVVTDIDNIEADDIAGVEAIYGQVGGTAPVITGGSSVTAQPGQVFQYQITASNAPISYYASGLPTGLTINTSTGLISGTVTGPADFYHVTITASNAAGSVTFTLVITVPGPPVITSVASVTAQAGQSFTYQIAATALPTSFTATGFNGYPLPQGISVDNATGLVSGIMPDWPDSIFVGATNSYGTGTARLQLNATPAPPIILGVYGFIPFTSSHAYVGTYSIFQIDSRRGATSFTAMGLPPGLSINPFSGNIQGMPVATGTYTVTLTATNAVGTGTYVWTLPVGQTIALASGPLTGTVGTPLTYQLSGTQAATHYQFTYYNDHAGLSMDPATGIITGSPVMPGTGSYRVTMSSDTDMGVMDLPINIAPNYVSAFFLQENPSFGLDGSFNGVLFLQFLYGSPFGYYSYLSDRHYIYHFDMGYEYVFDAADGLGGAYFYDFKSEGFFYSSPNFPFPYLYDFSLNSVVYYYPDPVNQWHYNTNGIRYFYVVNTGQIISK